MNLNKRAGLFATSLVVIAPVILWLAYTPRYSDAAIKLSGLVALSLLCWNVILTARLRLFDRLFFGLDRMYRLHHYLGIWVVILVCIHITLITLKLADASLIAAYEFWLPGLKEIGEFAGRMAFMLLVVLVSATIYLNVSYRWFIMAMRVLGLTVFLGGFHALFVTGSDLRSNLPLLVYMSAMGLAAIIVYIYRSLLRGSFTIPLEYTVVSVEAKENVTKIVLKPNDRPLPRYAGQFAFVTFHSEGVPPEQHPFTISNDSSDKNLRFCVKGLGDFTKQLRSLKPGDRAQVEGPYGTFSFTKFRSTKQAWIAGGIGITPFLSMASSLPERGYDIDLFYVVNSRAEAIFLEELKGHTARISGLSVHLVTTKSQGYLDAKQVLATAGKPKDFLLCGPPGMMKAMERQLVDAGIDKNIIHYEEFSL